MEKQPQKNYQNESSDEEDWKTAMLEEDEDEEKEEKEEERELPRTWWLEFDELAKVDFCFMRFFQRHLGPRRNNLSAFLAEKSLSFVLPSASVGHDGIIRIYEKEHRGFGSSK